MKVLGTQFFFQLTPMQDFLIDFFFIKLSPRYFDNNEENFTKMKISF